MERAGADACLIPMGDFHASEYISPYFGLIEYFTGFTGSAGTLVVLREGVSANAGDNPADNNGKTGQPSAYFWTDGRYFLQAEDQLSGTGIKLMKSGMEGVPKIAEFLGKIIADWVSQPDARKTFVISFDGRIVSSAYRDEMVKTINSRIESKNPGKTKHEKTNPENSSPEQENTGNGIAYDISKQYDIITGFDFAGEVWDEDPSCPRPALPSDPVWDLPVPFAGKSREEKIAWLLERMQAAGADAFVLSALDEIAWLLNLRGSDIDFNPVFLSYLIVARDVDAGGRNRETYDEEPDGILRFEEKADGEWGVYLYTNTDDLPETFSAGTIHNAKLYIRKYEDFYTDLASVIKGKTVWADEDSCSCRMIETLEIGAKDLIRKPSPVILEKAVKNETEIANIKAAHIKDGVAVTKWICMLKQMECDFEKTENPDAQNTEQGTGSKKCESENTVTELSAAALLEEYRKEQTDYQGQSFAPIIAFREHGAIVHYEPTPESDVKIEFGKGFLLLADTGGHYLEGTTDITRTISLGKPSKEQKQHYTAVLKGHLALLDAVFLDGAAGSSLDQLARQPLYRLGLDYRHGTGHGVGYLLNVHEGPNAFRMKYTAENVIKEGMVTSDEPGVYLEGRYGIRIESLILSVFRQETEYGRFLGFEPLTMVPFDRASIEEGMLSSEEKVVLNKYHKQVFETLSPYLTEDEKTWLAEETGEM